MAPVDEDIGFFGIKLTWNSSALSVGRLMTSVLCLTAIKTIELTRSVFYRTADNHISGAADIAIHENQWLL
jgi:hypothetical protein